MQVRLRVIRSTGLALLGIHSPATTLLLLNIKHLLDISASKKLYTISSTWLISCSPPIFRFILRPSSGPPALLVPQRHRALPPLPPRRYLSLQSHSGSFLSAPTVQPATISLYHEEAGGWRCSQVHTQLHDSRSTGSASLRPPALACATVIPPELHQPTHLC